MLRERIQKADGLEETVRRQELVIEKLEAMITNYMKEKRLRGKIVPLSRVRVRRVFVGVFNDVDRTFLSEHAAIGIQSQQLQVGATNRCRSECVHTLL